MEVKFCKTYLLWPKFIIFIKWLYNNINCYKLFNKKVWNITKLSKISVRAHHHQTVSYADHYSIIRKLLDLPSTHNVIQNHHTRGLTDILFYNIIYSSYDAPSKTFERDNTPYQFWVLTFLIVENTLAYIKIVTVFPPASYLSWWNFWKEKKNCPTSGNFSAIIPFGWGIPPQFCNRRCDSCVHFGFGAELTCAITDSSSSSVMKSGI
jgi:hypothetical protein